MGISYLYVNIAAFTCFTMLFISFVASERTREMKAWLVLILDLMLWSGASTLMRMDLYPGYVFWYYVALMSLYLTIFLVYNYVFRLTKSDRKAEWQVFLVATIIILVLSALGLLLEPPVKTHDQYGRFVYVYSTDWRIAIPSAMFLIIISTVLRMFFAVLRKKKSGVPGINELIVGCCLLAVGSSLLLFPGSTFPWDCFCGVLFASLICISIYKRRMFSTTLLIASSMLIIITAIMLVLTAALFFSRMDQFFDLKGFGILNTEAETFILLAIFILVAVTIFAKLVRIIFTTQEQQNARIKRYSDSVSRTLNIDDILSATTEVIESEIGVSKIYVYMLDKDRFVPVRSEGDEKSSDYGISMVSPWIRYLENKEDHIVLKNFASNPLYKMMSVEDRQALKDKSIACICALKDNDKISGLLMLTEKTKGMSPTYVHADFSFLNTVCSVASMALKNARLYENVAEREHLFSSMTAYIPTVILIKPKSVPSFCFISANTEKVLGLKYEFFASHSPSDALIESIGIEKAERVLSEFAEAPMTGYNFDMPFIRPDDGTEHTIRCAFSKITSDGRITHYVYVLSDISADIQARELLRGSVEIAQKSNKAKGEFLSHMSHEIRTPMNSIAGLTYLAREHIGNSNDKVLTGYLEQIDQSSHYLLNLLNNIMDMSKIENQLYEIRKEPFNIDEVIEKICAVYSTQMEAKKINFIISAEGFENKNLIGDEIALQKILNNLLSNAYKFTSEGGEIKLYATQRYVADRSVVMHFEVSDTGVGISKEFVDRIFEPYTQEAVPDIDNISGSGLGMAICKNMVDMQGGHIKATSNIGEGTKFSIDIPYGISAENKKNENKTELDYSKLKGKRIMVVDDVAINTMITRKLLEKHGAVIDSAVNGKEAVEMFNTNNSYYYDCILMDIQMPVMNGFEAAQTIRAIRSHYAETVPILAMTADAFLNDSADVVRSNFDGYIIKPVSPKTLYERLIQLFVERD